MPLIEMDIENLEKEHICCAISDKKGESCVAAKKTWMKEAFEKGLVFKKLDVRGKVFTEYIPAENAWAPIEAPNYMYINCFWVSGQYKGQGYANNLLESCIRDAKEKGKVGLVILSSEKKMPFLSDPKYLKYKGFKVCDIAAPYFELLYFPFDESAELPKFKAQAKTGEVQEKELVFYYTHQCPHTVKYVPIVSNLAKKHGFDVIVHHLTDIGMAQNAPTPFTTYSIYWNGKFVTNEILSEKRFEKLFLTGNKEVELV